MDIGAASAVNLYNYQSTVQTSGQSAAALQALAKTYSGAAASGAGLFPSADPLAALTVSSDTLGALVGGIYSTSATKESSIPGLSSAGNGGLTVSDVSSLLGRGGSSSPASTGLEELSSTKLNPDLAAAMASYQYQQSIGATAAPSTHATNSGPASQVIQAAQATQFSSALNLLA